MKKFRHLILAILALALLLSGVALAERIILEDKSGNEAEIGTNFDFDVDYQNCVYFDFGYDGELYIWMEKDTGETYEEYYNNGEAFFPVYYPYGSYSMWFFDPDGNEIGYCQMNIYASGGGDSSGGDDYYEEPEPEPMYVGDPNVSVSPIIYDDTVAQESDIYLEWYADGAYAYDVFMYGVGYGGNVFEASYTGDTSFVIPAYSLNSDDYMLSVTAFAADGNRSSTVERWFHVASTVTPEPANPVGGVSLTLSPEMGEGVVAQEYEFRFEWYAEYADYYAVRLCAADGTELAAANTYDTMYAVPGGVLAAGDYVFYVTAYGADGSNSSAEKWLRVESSITPEPANPVGDVSLSLSPEMGEGVVAQENEFRFEWYAEYADYYAVRLCAADGTELAGAVNTYDTGYYLPGGALAAGDYVFYVTAYGADGSNSSAEKWFRVESSITPEPANPVGDVSLSLSPEMGEGVVAQENEFRFEWYAEYADYYAVRLCAADGTELAGAANTYDTGYYLPGGVLTAGDYVFYVTAYGADGSSSSAEKWFRVESSVTPEPVNPVGSVSLSLSPEMGEGVVAQEYEFRFEWYAEYADYYAVRLCAADGTELAGAANTYDTGYYLPGGALAAGDYVFYVTAYGADGSSSSAEKWFRVESSITPEPANPVGSVSLTLSPEMSEGVVAQEYEFRFDWYAEYADYYAVRLCAADGTELAGAANTYDTGYYLPGGALAAGDYVFYVTAYGADGSSSSAEKWFRVESSVTPEPVNPVGSVSLTLSPEMGEGVVAQENEFRFDWYAEYADYYAVRLCAADGTELAGAANTYDTGYYLPGGALAAGDYVFYVTAYGADGSSSSAEKWFRVESSITPEPVNPVGSVSLSLSPEMGEGVVAQENEFRFDWYAEYADYYAVRLCAADGTELAGAANIYDTGYYLPGGALTAGDYVFYVTAYGADGSSSSAEKWFRVESSVTPEPVNPVGSVSLTLSPEMGEGVVAQEYEFRFDWYAEYAEYYEICINYSDGSILLQPMQLMDTAYIIPGGAVLAGDYVCYVTAYGADGSSSSAEKWFRVESSVTPEPDPVTPEPDPVTPEPDPVTPEPDPVTPEPDPITPEPDPITPEPEIPTVVLGEPVLQVGPELYNDGKSVVAREERINFSWAAENAVGYEISIIYENGAVLIPPSSQTESGSYIDGNIIDAGSYLLRVTAFGADGSTTYAEKWFRVESGVTPEPDPVTPEPDPVTPEPDPVTPEPENGEPEHSEEEVPPTKVPSGPENNGRPDGNPTPGIGSGEADGTVPPPSPALSNPKIYINNTEVAGDTMVVSEGSVVSASWYCEDAEYYIVEMYNQSTGENIYSYQTADTAISLSPDMFVAGNSYILRVHAGIMGFPHTVSSDACIQVTTEFVDEPLAIWFNSEYRSENGQNYVTPGTQIALGWNLTSEGMLMRIFSADGQLLHEAGVANMNSILFNADLFVPGSGYTVELELPEQVKTAQLSFQMDQIATPPPTPDNSVENVVISIEAIDGAGRYETVGGTALLPLDIYILPADAQLRVRMTANVNPYPACNIRLVDYMTQKVIQSSNNSTLQEWSTSMSSLTPGTIYVLEVTPVGRGGLPAFFLFTAEDAADQPTQESGLNVRFIGNPAIGMVSLGGVDHQASIFGQVQNLALYWNQIGDASFYYNVTLYQRMNTGRKTLYSDVAAGESYILDYNLVGMEEYLIYEVEVSTPDGRYVESRYFYFTEPAGQTGMVSPIVTVSPLPGRTTPPPTRKPIITVAPIQTFTPIRTTSAPIGMQTIEPFGGIQTMSPIGTMEPLSLNGSAGNNQGQTGNTSTAQLSMNEIPQRITQGTSEALDGMISSGMPLESVQILYQGNVIFQRDGISARNFNMNAYIVDTLSDPTWQGKTGEHILEVYVSYQETAPAATASPGLPLLQVGSLQINLPTVQPIGGSSANPSQMQKLGDVRILIETVAPALTGEGTGLQLTAYDMDSSYARTAARSITPFESAIDFSWQAGAMDVGGNSIENAETNWDGWIQAKQTDRVRFEVYATNGVRLTVDGQRLIDTWNAQPANSYVTGWIDVEAGKKYLISLDNFQLDAGGDLKLYWEYESQSGQREIVPKEYLYSTTSQLLTPEAIQAAVAQFGLNANQEDVLNYVAMLASDDRFSEEIMRAMDANLPIVFLIEGRGSTAQVFGGSLHAQGRMDAALVTVYNRSVIQYASSASTLPDIPKEGFTLAEGAFGVSYAGVESSSGVMPHLMLGKAEILSCVDMQCSLCGTLVSGTNAWHGCTSEDHDLEILAASGWAVKAADVKLNQGLVLGQQEFSDLSTLLQSTGNALVVVDRKHMDDSRLDYEWLYDHVGLERLLQ